MHPPAEEASHLPPPAGSRVRMCAAADHVEHSGNVPLGQLLQRTGKYNMGHMVWPADDC